MEPAAISTYPFSSRPVFVAFFLYAFALGTLFPRLGDLQLEMGLSESELGLSLIGLPLGVQLSFSSKQDYQLFSAGTDHDFRLDNDCV